MRVAVVGGGIAGLSAAWRLGGGVDTTVFEPGPLGGVLRTGKLAGGTVELGPDAFVTRAPEAGALCRELDLEADLVAPAATGAQVLLGGSLRTLPDGLVLGAPRRLAPLLRSGLLTPAGAARAAADLLLPRSDPGDDPSVWNLVARRFGTQVAARLVDPLVGGIHAGRTDELSAEATTPQLLAAARSSRSLMVALRRLPPPSERGAPMFLAPRGGFGALCQRLVDRLAARETTFVTDTVRSVEQVAPNRWRVEPDAGEFDAVVLAVSAPVAATLLGELAPTALLTIPSASVAVINLAYPEGALPVPDGVSGFLVARSEGTLMTACSFASAKWPHWATPRSTLLRVSVGRYRDDRWAALDDDHLVAAVHAEVCAALRAGAEPPREALVTRWPDAFPQYLPGHLRRVAGIEGQLQATAPGVALAGNSYRGSGIPACIASGWQAATALLETVPVQ